VKSIHGDIMEPGSLREKIRMMMDEKGEYTEDLILFLINEKVERYENLKMKIKTGEIRESAGMVDSITKLENSIVESVEKYLRLKYPHRYSIRLLKEEDRNLISEEEYKELKLLLEQFQGK